MKNFKTGFVSIVGRPNVGKSTLLNCFLEQKLSIVTRKPQTTRWNLQGIKTTKDYQIIFIDTPGLQKEPKLTLNRYMNKYVLNSLDEVDVILFMVEASKWNELDVNALNHLKNISRKKLILVINKIDKLNDKSKLLSTIDDLSIKTDISEIIPVSAKKEDNMDELLSSILKKLPTGSLLYPEDQITDRSERFFAAEFIREKLILRLSDEIPYRLSVTIDEFKNENNIIHIYATIWVEKSGQKAIVIGKEGSVLKSIGESARKSMESFYDRKVNLKTWVKVKEKWADSELALQQLGYHV